MTSAGDSNHQVQHQASHPRRESIWTAERDPIVTGRPPYNGDAVTMNDIHLLGISSVLVIDARLAFRRGDYVSH